MSSDKINGVSKALVDEALAACVKTYRQGEACTGPSPNGSENTVCLYVHPENPDMHCLIGHLMTEEELSNLGHLVEGVYGLHFEEGFRSNLTDMEVSFLSRLQCSHDNCGTANDSDFHRRFRHNLNRQLKNEYSEINKLIQSALDKEARFQQRG